MKRIIVLIALLFFCGFMSSALADDIDGSYGGIEDVYKYTQGFENGFTGQKMITDEQFQKTLEEVKAKQAKRKKGNKPLKGNSFNDETSGSHIKETADNITLLTLPVELINRDGVDIPIGLYKIVGEKSNENVYLNFYQSANLIAKVPAIETNSDFNEPEINFIKLIPYDGNRVKIIFGSMDFNAYTFVRVRN